ncbi:WXG100 family type VII secretion target [Rhodococcus sp. TAF43]|uniref:WXG100 family type VII secretion target n=1 Tax=unclassified Rhodococcus (in: high G+C Gram-positive bacteria) TaxID=192944 RepID=UPI000E2BD679|nr:MULTISPECIES: WXG100 family type VII secretion target [unclassified Rhodococcus (in: high G+C Gram-positive bacteria)]RDI34005.1 WXG100 family type VII secretion target [Rhodococcus sp. AG1013]
MGGQDQLKATTETMEATSRRVGEMKGDLDGLLGRIRAEVDGIRGSWGGGAAGAFQNLMEQWDGSSKKLNDALQSISENIKANSVQFDTTQQDHTAAINNVASSLNMS